jgi:hypothetical protein
VVGGLVRRVCALVLVAGALWGAGCGSAEEKAESTPAETATAAPATERDVLDRLPEVPEATESTLPPASTDGTGGDAFLRDVFDDGQSVWTEEFEAAGVRLGDIAQAYVVAHEVAHHVQELLGILPRVRTADQQDPAGENARSVRLELQADCLAGIWKHSRYRRGQLSPTDFEDALRAAAVVGNDFQQHRATGTIRPEDWTYGSSRRRQHWLTTGFEQGTPAACDTFGS